MHIPLQIILRLVRRFRHVQLDISVLIWGIRKYGTAVCMYSTVQCSRGSLLVVRILPAYRIRTLYRTNSVHNTDTYHTLICYKRARLSRGDSVTKARLT